MLLKPAPISIDSFYKCLANQARHAPSSCEICRRWHQTQSTEVFLYFWRKRKYRSLIWTLVEVKEGLRFSVCENECESEGATVLPITFFSRKGNGEMPQILLRSISKSYTEGVNNTNMPYNRDTLELYSKYWMWPKSFIMWAASQYRSYHPPIHGHTAFFLSSQRSNSICMASSAVLGMEKHYVITE